MKTRYLISFFVFFVFFVVQSDLSASENVDHAATLTPFLNDDTTIVAYLDVAALPATGNPAELIPILPSLPPQAQSTLLALTTAGAMVHNIQAAGGQGVYLVFGLLDIYDVGGPVLIVTTSPNKRPEDVEKLLRDSFQSLRNSKEFTDHPLAKILEARRHGREVLVGTKYTLGRYEFLKATPRNDILGPLARLTDEGAVLAVVDAPGPDCRRIFRELWPTLPQPFTPLKGELVDHLKHVEFAANLPPNVNPRLVIQTTDAATAQTFVDLYRAIPTAVDEFTELGKEREEVKLAVEMVTSLITPQLDGTRVTLTLSAPKLPLENLQSTLSGLTDKALESSRRRDRMDRFRQVLIAMHRYADANKHFPPAAIHDQDGKPLLSWRAAILPFLDEGKELYRQFHLNEPWDSPHNSALIAQMPAIFADPDPKVRQAAGDGKTTFHVPVAAETILFSNDGTKFSQITDGTSKTIVLVEVDPLRAAVWTRPEDWHVDIEHPRRGIERKDRNIITAGFADGHVEALRADIDDGALRSQLTRAAGD